MGRASPKKSHRYSLEFKRQAGRGLPIEAYLLPPSPLPASWSIIRHQTQ
jgi:hypothetical protein